MKCYSIFGAGVLGKRTLTEIGVDKVNFFIDNDVQKQGTFVEGIKVVSLEEYMNSGVDDIIQIPFGKYSLEIKKQLQECGIHKMRIHMNVTLYEPNLIINPYADGEEISFAYAQSEENRRLTNEYTLQLNEEKALFDSVEIETYNRCNGVCDFCPVSINNDTRIEEYMNMDLFKKIICELASMDYDRAVSLFSNNEPFLDERIIEMQKYAREKLPKAYLHMYSNGTLLTLDIFKKIIPYLDSLIIDNYSDELELNPRVKQVATYCEEHPELCSKVTIVLRKQHEVLTSRGGDAPNVNKVRSYGEDACFLPFEQMIIRPSGKVSLCCNDPLGKYTLGDLNHQSILEVWNGQAYGEIREKIRRGRKNIAKCEFCDVFWT